MWIDSCTDIDKLKKAEVMKDEFMSIASHELKTPLTSSKAYLQFALRHTSKHDKSFGMLNSSLNQLERLQRLTSDILDATKINAGKLQYDIAPFDFNELLINIVLSLQQTISTHQLEIVDSAKAMVLGDYHRIEQVMNNLISNAVKYSPNASSVQIQTTVTNKHLKVSVKDFGIGIKEEHINRLFDKFYRIETTAIRFQGMGRFIYCF